MVLKWNRLLALSATMLASFTPAQAATPAPNDPLISECKTVSCLRNLLRGPAGPTGPAGPAGRSAVKDVYAGSVRLGRLIALDGIAQCVSNTSRPLDIYKAGLLGLVETSTGHMVQLCIGAIYDFPSVGTGLGNLTESFDASALFFEQPGCQGPIFTPVRVIGSTAGVSFNPTDANGSLAGILGPILGKPRVAIVSDREIARTPGTTSRISRFMIVGPPTRITPRSYYQSGAQHCTDAVRPIPLDDYVQLSPNDPAVTGLPNEPVTPYTMVDVQ